MAAKADQLVQQLKSNGVRVTSDSRDNYTPGWKYNHWELKVRLQSSSSLAAFCSLWSSSSLAAFGTVWSSSLLAAFGNWWSSKVLLELMLGARD